MKNEIKNNKGSQIIELRPYFWEEYEYDYDDEAIEDSKRRLMVDEYGRTVLRPEFAAELEKMRDEWYKENQPQDDKDKTLNFIAKLGY